MDETGYHIHGLVIKPWVGGCVRHILAERARAGKPATSKASSRGLWLMYMWG